jgi:hypothetical protein
VITIEEKPDRPVCASHGPLRWGWFPDTRQGARWVSFTFTENGALAPHVCDDPERPQMRWFPSDAVAATAHRGAALARAVLAGEDPFNEKEERRE